MAKESMSDKMYKNSPTLETDDSGKKYIKKNEPTADQKESARVSDGTDGLVHERHTKELSDMYDRHMSERKDMVKRHMTEMKKLGPANPAGSGEAEIQRIENNGEA